MGVRGPRGVQRGYRWVNYGLMQMLGKGVQEKQRQRNPEGAARRTGGAEVSEVDVEQRS